MADFIERFRCAACGVCRLPCHITARGYVCKTCVWKFLKVLRVAVDRLSKEVA